MTAKACDFGWLARPETVLCESSGARCDVASWNESCRGEDHEDFGGPVVAYAPTCRGFRHLYAHPSVGRWDELRLTPVMCGSWSGLFSEHAAHPWAIYSEVGQDLSEQVCNGGDS